MPSYKSPLSRPAGAVNAVHMLPGHPNYKPPTGPLTRPAVNNYVPMQWQGHTIPPVQSVGPQNATQPYESPGPMNAGPPPNLGPAGSVSAATPAPPAPGIGPFPSEQAMGVMRGAIDRMRSARGQAMPLGGGPTVSGGSILGNPALKQAGRVASGGPINQPLGPVGSQYGNTPLAGAPMVNPRMGQTLQQAQGAYQSTMDDARQNTNSRVREMLQGGGQYQSTGPGPLIRGTMVGRSGQNLSIASKPGGGVSITGSMPAERWNDMPSQIAGANGRTRNEMFQARREAVRTENQARKDQTTVNWARRNRLNPQTNANVFAAMQRRGMPMRGGAQASVSPSAPADIEGHTRRLLTLGNSPAVKALGLSTEPSDLEANLQSLATAPDAMSAKERESLSAILDSQLALGGEGVTAAQRELVETFKRQGPRGLNLTLKSGTAAKPLTGRGYQYQPGAGPRIGGY